MKAIALLLLATASLAPAKLVTRTVDYTDVVTAETAAYTARMAVVQNAAQRQTTAVALIQALGGGWKTTTDRNLTK